MSVENLSRVSAMLPPPLLTAAAQPESRGIFPTVLRVLKFKIGVSSKSLVTQPSVVFGGKKALAYIWLPGKYSVGRKASSPPLIYSISLLLHAFKYWMDVDMTPR